MTAFYRFMTSCLLGILLALPIFPTSATAETGPIPYEEIAAFSRIFETIKNSYVEDVDDEELMRDAIRGMIDGLDPHSVLLDKRGVSQLRINTSGRYGGLGMEVTKEGNAIKVVSPIDGSPAYRAGIRSGDLIVRLDNILVDQMDLNEAVSIMRGLPGSEITLTVVREGASSPLTFTLKREIIKLTSVRSHLLEPNYGYVRITMFQTSTAELLNNAIRDLITQEDSLDGLVLDLRNNPGGELHSAIEVSDIFIEKGVIVSTKGRGGVVEREFSATPGDILSGTPVVVLVNEGSASASEIVAGALQDHKRAVVMGTRTFGKGSVQSILQIDDNTAIKLTTQRYYTPSNRSIQNSGIAPDIVVEEQQLTAVDNDQTTYRESDLTGALENESGEMPESDQQDSQTHPSVAGDYQLQQALNVLKALSIGRQQIVSG